MQTGPEVLEEWEVNGDRWRVMGEVQERETMVYLHYQYEENWWQSVAHDGAPRSKLPPANDRYGAHIRVPNCPHWLSHLLRGDYLTQVALAIEELRRRVDRYYETRGDVALRSLAERLAERKAEQERRACNARGGVVLPSPPVVPEPPPNPFVMPPPNPPPAGHVPPEHIALAREVYAEGRAMQAEAAERDGAETCVHRREPKPVRTREQHKGGHSPLPPPPAPPPPVRR